MQLPGLFTPPYYAVIFTSLRTEIEEGYAEMAESMERLASTQPGFLGIDSARSAVGVTVSYWRTLDDVRAWKAVQAHTVAQRLGREKWYSAYTTRVAKIEYEYEYPTHP